MFGMELFGCLGLKVWARLLGSMCLVWSFLGVVWGLKFGPWDFGFWILALGFGIREYEI